jgi:predicted ATPase
VGKTRLALQVAEQVLPRFGDGAWLCELAPIRDAAGVDDAVAAVFSVTARGGQSTRDALVEFLRNKELLLVLDNCEHLLAGAAALAVALERSCARLVILATSREGLGIEGEHLLPVPPLGVPEAGADLAAITEAEAVRLFAERAAAVKPGFQVTGQNAAAVAAVARRLDGIALAVELAAARVGAMTPAELARRLERSFAVLAAGRRGAGARHQTLRATIDWSFQLLSGPEQALLARLAVFAGGATLEAAETVCGGEGIDPDVVFELLAALVARSLVVAEEHGPQTRYRLLETIRQYGEERLDQAGETERWRARHAGYYAGFPRQVREHDRDGGEVFWAVRLSAEQDNLLAAWSWAVDTSNVDTAFAILAGFAPCEVWSSYPLLLPGAAALELPRIELTRRQRQCLRLRHRQQPPHQRAGRVDRVASRQREQDRGALPARPGDTTGLARVPHVVPQETLGERLEPLGVIRERRHSHLAVQAVGPCDLTDHHETLAHPDRLVASGEANRIGRGGGPGGKLVP